ncbi:MAG: STAS domain-containing protein [Oscillospiraceae bacterium]|nr:STAS domain-containing protein [Oscillospiraceae bacterium]MDD3833669.1 STAS domain-containing protein [Oscillospiraceae bacterium]MDD4546243.1 STAS domain-containing protein [Oscillospiraceae bacterium]
MSVRIESSNEGMTAFLMGEIDHHTARQIREAIDTAVEKSKPKNLYLDFSEVSFMDSSGIGLIMGRFKLMQHYSGKLTVTGASERITKIISLAGLKRLGIFNNAQ